MTPPPEPRRSLQGLLPLVAPVYAPSIAYAAGAASLVPAQVLLALQLGFSAAQVAGLLTWIGAFAVYSSWAAGGIVERLGESRALVVVTAAGAAGLTVAAGAAATQAPGAGWGLVAALTLVDLVDAVWAVARQGVVADLAPAGSRGLAMNLYGAAQRLGRVLGPAVAAGVLLLTGPAAVLPVAAGVMLAATAWMVRRLPPRRSDPPVRPGDVPDPHVPRRLGRTMLLLGAGVLVLAALRTTKESLLPLWADQGVHLPAAQVALVMTVASTAELVLFWPAGVALDRLGRAPVVVTAMALMSAGLCLTPVSTAPAWLFACVALVGLGDGAGAGIVKVLGTDLAPQVGRARFFGRWQSIASVGSLVAPVVATLLITTASLPAALVALGVLGALGTVWMAWWTPRLVSRG